jgi:hypothetical protein
MTDKNPSNKKLLRMLTGIRASMQFYSKSPLFPIFLSSQLPIFSLHPLAAGGINLYLPFR